MNTNGFLAVDAKLNDTQALLVAESTDIQELVIQKFSELTTLVQNRFDSLEDLQVAESLKIRALLINTFAMFYDYMDMRFDAIDKQLRMARRMLSSTNLEQIYNGPALDKDSVYCNTTSCPLPDEYPTAEDDVNPFI